MGDARTRRSPRPCARPAIAQGDQGQLRRREEPADQDEHHDEGEAGEDAVHAGQHSAAAVRAGNDPGERGSGRGAD